MAQHLSLNPMVTEKGLRRLEANTIVEGNDANRRLGFHFPDMMGGRMEGEGALGLEAEGGMRNGV